MSRSRSRFRDLHIYDANDPQTVLGGLIVTHGMTNSNLYTMSEIFLKFDKDYLMKREDGTEVQKDQQQLEPGNYYIFTNGLIQVDDEKCLLRTVSAGTGIRISAFREAVRRRDRRCVISGQLVYFDFWEPFEAAHIFPLAYEDHWKQFDYGRHITIQPANERAGTINSVQNGMLLEAGLHKQFDTYGFSINPDDNHKIVFFHPDGRGLAGKFLDQQLLQDPARPVDELFRWHFRQAVLSNMRGAGEPIFECDFPPGSDVIGEILSGPMAPERMEFELFNRLALIDGEDTVRVF